MCRNIKPLYNFEPPATHDEVQASALQFVRKISGFTKPSQVNQEVFDAAVLEVTLAAQKLIDGLSTSASPKNRLIEAQAQKERNAKRFG